MDMHLLREHIRWPTGMDDFSVNARYGEHGLMKLLAEKRHPRYLIHRKRVFRLFTKRKKQKS